jgi:hypothetical protein
LYEVRVSECFVAFQATMVCMDNSEWMRNGDYLPTRFQAQADAVNLICGAKTQVTLQKNHTVVVWGLD